MVDVNSTFAVPDPFGPGLACAAATDGTPQVCGAAGRGARRVVRDRLNGRVRRKLSRSPPLPLRGSVESANQTTGCAALHPWLQAAAPLGPGGELGGVENNGAGRILQSWHCALQETGCWSGAVYLDRSSSFSRLAAAEHWTRVDWSSRSFSRRATEGLTVDLFAAAPRTKAAWARTAGSSSAM